MKYSFTVIALLSGSTFASPYVSEQQLSMYDMQGDLTGVTIDISGMNSWDLQGDPDNELLESALGGGFHIFGISWDVGISTVGESWLSEAVIGIEDELFLTLAAGDNFAGTASYSSGGIFDLVAIGRDFFISEDGILNLEFFELFDDVDGAIDAHFRQGSRMTFHYVAVPSPSAVSILSFAGLMMRRRKR